MNNSNRKIFNPTDCISEQTMFDYIDNKLSAKERHTVEKHLLDCELCSDALEGLELLKDRGRIGVINQKVNELIAPAKEKKVIAINYRTVIAIAAGLALLIGGVFFFKQFTSNQMMEEKSVADLKEPVSVDVLKRVGKEVADSSEVQLDLKDDVQPMAEKQVQQPTKNKKPLTISETKALPSSPPSAGAATSVSEKITNDLETIAANEQDEKSDKFIKEEKPAPALSQTAGASKSKEKKSEDKRSNDYAKSNKTAYNTNTPQNTADNNDRELLSNNSNENDSIYTVVDQMPEFPGGEEELLKYVKKNIQMPPTDDNNNTYETAFIQFVIDKTGTAIDPKLLKPQSKRLQGQIIRMVNKMPAWSPGKKNGQTVSVKYKLPIKMEVK